MAATIASEDAQFCRRLGEHGKGIIEGIYEAKRKVEGDKVLCVCVCVCVYACVCVCVCVCVCTYIHIHLYAYIGAGQLVDTLTCILLSYDMHPPPHMTCFLLM
jgi:hypothetical protein